MYTIFAFFGNMDYILFPRGWGDKNKTGWGSVSKKS